MTLSLTPASLGIEPDHAWLLDLDFTDLLEGPEEELEALVQSAPTTAAKFWLSGWMLNRSLLRALGG